MSSVTAILNLHREGELASPSVQSALAAVRTAGDHGLKADLLVILDRPDRATVEFIDPLTSDSNLRYEKVDFGDLALSRNHGVEICTSEFVGFLDGDDLWCDSWLAACHDLCQADGRQSICHPEWNLIFGSSEMHFIHMDQKSRYLSLTSLRSTNYWTALSFAHRSVYEAHPYQRNQINDGFGYEDWSWNCETIANGYEHRVVPKTTHFIRYKDSGSLRSQTNVRGCLRSPSTLFEHRSDAAH